MASPERRMIPIDELHFDSRNPRLPDNMDKSDENAVIHWMIRNGNIMDLMSSIATSGFSSAEAILVVPRDLGGFEVVEGNRRLAAVKLLNDPALATVKRQSIADIVSDCDPSNIPAKLPALKYNDRDEILVYLGYRHITGVKSWGAEEKAKYLKQLYEHYRALGLSDDEIYKQIAKSVATKPLYAKRTLTTLAITALAAEKNYWAEERLSDEHIKFSVLGTALAYPPIYKHIGLEDPGDKSLTGIDEKNLQELLKWLFMPIDSAGNSAVKESRQLSTLAKVLSSTEATRLFRDGKSLEEASLFTDEADENFMRLIDSALQNLDEANRYLKKLRNPTEDMLTTLRDIYRVAKTLGVSIKEIGKDNDDEAF